MTEHSWRLRALLLHTVSKLVIVSVYTTIQIKNIECWHIYLTFVCIMASQCSIEISCFPVLASDHAAVLIPSAPSEFSVWSPSQNNCLGQQPYNPRHPCHIHYGDFPVTAMYSGCNKRNDRTIVFCRKKLSKIERAIPVMSISLPRILPRAQSYPNLS